MVLSYEFMDSDANKKYLTLIYYLHIKENNFKPKTK